MFESLINKKPLSVAENWHEDFIPSLVKILRPKVYVELGLYHCELFNKVIPYADKLIGIDVDDSCKKFMKKNKKTTFVNKTTEEYAKLLKKKPIVIDMLFIDADHTKEQVIKDFKAFFPYVKEQGIILLHDTYPKNKKYTNDRYCSNAYEAAIALGKKTNLYELVTIPIHPGLTICRKRKHQLTWQK